MGKVQPKGGEEARQCKDWLQAILSADIRVRVPVIADYEVRRKLIQADKYDGINRLDRLCWNLGTLSIDWRTMKEAAVFWADARKRGLPTAPDPALDADCILAAQAKMVPVTVKFTRAERVRGISPLIATTNPGHLARYSPAKLWSEIRPEDLATG